MTVRENWDELFTKRMSRCYDEMKWLYGELYHGDEEAFEYFLSMLYRNYSQRSEALKALDESREALPA